jgi:hypothetical protein
MAPPIGLSNVAGTLALSFTAGRAAPASEPAPLQAPTSVPAPPATPPTADETPESPTTPEPPTTPAPAATPAPASTTVEAPFSGPIEPGREAESEEDREAPAPVTPPRLLRPNSRTRMFSLFAGGSRALRGGYSYFGSELKGEASFGGFDDRFRVGGFGVVQVISGFPFNSFTFAPRLSLNRQIVPGHAFYFTTNLTLGYRMTTYRASYFDGYDDGYYGGGDEPSRIAYHSAVLGVSWGASAIIAERLLLSFRPLDLELVAPAPGIVQINWAAMGGIGVLLGKPAAKKR